MDRSERYPLGVMSTYRAFVQDEVFEILKKTVDSANPLSLGLEPWLTHVHSFPTDNDPPLHILRDIPFGAIFLHGFKLGCVQKLNIGVQSFIRAFPGKPESIDEWKKFLRLSPQSDLVNDYINNGGILYVPLKSLLFSACYLDTAEIVPPLLPPKDSKGSNNKRSHDGKLIKERTTTCNVPNSNDRGNKKSRIPVNPEDDVPEAVMNEREKEEFIKNISTLKKEMLSKQQLTKLLSDVNEKTTGNKQVLLERIQLYYSRAPAAAGEKVAPAAAIAAVGKTVPAAAAATGGKTAPAAAAAVGKSTPAADTVVLIAAPAVAKTVSVSAASVVETLPTATAAKAVPAAAAAAVVRKAVPAAAAAVVKTAPAASQVVPKTVPATVGAVVKTAPVPAAAVAAAAVRKNVPAAAAAVEKAAPPAAAAAVGKTVPAAAAAVVKTKTVPATVGAVVKTAPAPAAAVAVEKAAPTAAAAVEKAALASAGAVGKTVPAATAAVARKKEP